MKNKQNLSVLQAIKTHWDDIRECLGLQMRLAALTMVQNLFQEEVQSLCGAMFQHKKGE